MSINIGQKHEDLLAKPSEPMVQSNRGYQNTFKPITTTEKNKARIEADKATAEYLASGSTITHCKTTSTPAWLLRRKSRKPLNVVSTADLLKESTS